MTSSIIKSQNIQVGKFTLSPYGLGASGKPTYAEWVECGDWIKRVEGAVQWWRGDWSNFGEQAYGEKYAQEIDKFGIDYSTVNSERYVSRQFEFVRRRTNLSWSHHAEVASLEPSEQDELLDQAEVEGWHRKDIRREVRLRKARILAEPTSLALAPTLITPGEVWQLGKHRLMCGNAYCEHDMARLADGLDVEAMISDPPYGIGYEPDWDKWDGSQGDFSPVVGDNDPFDPSPFLRYPTLALFGANYFSDRLPIGNWACWDKRLSEEADAMFGSPFELAWFRSPLTTRKAIMIRVLHGGVVNADSVSGNNERRYVATQKPVKVMGRLIEELTAHGDIVLDPFCGSGPTVLACEQLGRTCLAMDIHPEAVAITLQRWSALTGQEPCQV